MPTNLLILPLLGGFIFLHVCHRFRFRAQRSDGYRLLLESAIAATILLYLGRVVVVVLRGLPFGPSLNAAWEGFAPIPYLGTGAASLILGLVLALLFNWLNEPGPPSARSLAPWRFPVREAKRRSRLNSEHARNGEIVAHGNALVRLIHEAEKTSTLVSISLSNRKWYVGYIAEAWSLDPQEAYLRLLPILSGYRDPANLGAIRTIYYRKLYSLPHINKDRFVIVIPLKDVQMASLFDENVYEDYLASPQHGVGRGRRGESSIPPELRKSIAIRASAEWKP